MKKFFWQIAFLQVLLTALVILPHHVKAQAASVSGVVRSAADQQILPGVTVAVKNTQTGTTTDQNGRFELPDVPYNAVLVFSFVGFKSQEKAVGSNTVLDITLQEDNAQLDEVVVVGYGTQRKRDVTGAVTSVKSEDIQKVATSSFTSAIQGKVPGVQISQTSGAPGGSSSVRIRGVGSTGNNQPLYVIDGMPLGGGSMSIGGSSDRIDGLSVVNPNDIESIEVLKDAAAAAIYGARAANGVILITTKRGKEGQAKVTFDAYTGVQQLWQKPAFLNATEFTTLANELYTNSGMSPNPEWANPASFGEGTNWIDQVYRNAALKNYDVSVTGGTQKLKGALSLGYRDQEGTLIETWYKRYTGRASADLQVNDKLNFGSSISFSYSQAKGQRNEEMRVGIFNLAQQFYPTLGPNDVVNGSSAYYTTQGDNPLLRARSIDNQLQNIRVFGNAFGEYEILSGLKLRTSVGIDVNNDRSTTWEPKAERGHYRNLQATLGETFSQGLNWLLENTLSYTKILGDHNISALVGQTAQKNNNNWISVTGRDYQNEQIRVINSSNENERRANGTGSEYALASYLGRVNYAFKDRYLFSASIRRDGSSNFGPNHKWGNFPSVSAGWNIDSEPFMQQVKGLTSLKLRGSWGQLGNDAIGAFGYLSTIRLGTVNDNYVLGLNQGLVIGASMSRPGNPDLKWETSEQTNIGLDASFLNNKVYLTADYYIKNTRDMLIALPVSLEAGFQNAPSINGGHVQNRGLELLLGYRQDLGDFHFDLSGNMATLKNEVKSLGVGQPITGSSVSSYYTMSATYTEVGQPIGYFRGYMVDGIYQTSDAVNKTLQPNAVAGDFIYRDVNQDNQLSDADRVNLGSPWPSLMYGMNLDVTYKGFDINVMLQGISGSEIFHANKRSIYPLKYFGGSGVVNASKEALNRWTPGSGRNDIPRLAYTDSNGNFASSSSFYVEEGDYMRIRNLTLGYRIPGDLVKRTGLIQGIRLYVNAQNLFTFTKYSGFDPEIGSTDPLQSGVDDGVYPQPRTFMAGINVSF
ncbi:MAG: TonB-dependent receptor plug [Adhaeribacter sp.]|nr:TonB-dependent receptor plug [Adhaeribacter sp.]